MVITRLGAVPSRKFVESIGVQFGRRMPMRCRSSRRSFESNVPGVFIIGALAGYPLIKQAMNQGYEVIEHLLGNAVEPADHALLQKKLGGLRIRGRPRRRGPGAARPSSSALHLFRDVKPHGVARARSS